MTHHTSTLTRSFTDMVGYWFYIGAGWGKVCKETSPRTQRLPSTASTRTRNLMIQCFTVRWRCHISHGLFRDMEGEFWKKNLVPIQNIFSKSSFFFQQEITNFHIIPFCNSSLPLLLLIFHCLYLNIYSSLLSARSSKFETISSTFCHLTPPHPPPQSLPSMP